MDQEQQSDNKMSILAALNETIADTQSKLAVVCRRGCSHCCTRSVTMTELEGRLILEYLRSQPENRLEYSLRCLPRTTPPLSTNAFAEQLLGNSCPDSKLHSDQDREGKRAATRQYREYGEEPHSAADKGIGLKAAWNDEDCLWDFTPCTYLQGQECTIYPVRPVACRIFTSTVSCAPEGSAELPALAITLNTVILQLAEHLDQGRVWGQLDDVLVHLHSGGHARRESLSLGRPLPALLIPPEEQEQVATLVNTFYSRKVFGRSIYHHLFALSPAGEHGCHEQRMSG